MYGAKVMKTEELIPSAVRAWAWGKVIGLSIVVVAQKSPDLEIQTSEWVIITTKLSDGVKNWLGLASNRQHGRGSPQNLILSVDHAYGLPTTSTCSLVPRPHPAFNVSLRVTLKAGCGLGTRLVHMHTYGWPRAFCSCAQLHRLEDTARGVLCALQRLRPLVLKSKSSIQHSHTLKLNWPFSDSIHSDLQSITGRRVCSRRLKGGVDTWLIYC